MPKAKAAPKPSPAAEALASLPEKHQVFVRAVLGGKSDVVAYQEAYGCTRANAEANAWRVKDNEGVKTALAAAQYELAEDSVLSLKQKRAWLKMVIETPLDEIDADSTMCQEWTFEASGGTRGKLKRGEAPEGNEVTEEPRPTVKIKAVDKLAAMRLDAQLAGELSADKAANKQAEALGELGEALNRIRGVTHGN